MKTLSLTEYKKQRLASNICIKLQEVGFSETTFIEVVIQIAKSIQHLVPIHNLESFSSGIEIAEKYLRGESTMEECKKVSNDIFLISDSNSHLVVAAYVAWAPAIFAFSRMPISFCISQAAGFATSFFNDADIVREYFPWNLVCGFQIAIVFEKSENKTFVKELSENQQLIDYATIILEDQNLREEFEFLMKNYKGY